MYSWDTSRKVSMIIILILIYLSSSAVAQGNPFQCTSNGNYTRNSTYNNNLNALLRSLSLNMTNFGFHSASVGPSPDTVNGLALCRADRTLDLCRACVDSAAREVLLSCPNQRQAVIWFEYCTLRYTNDPLYRMQTADQTVRLLNTQNVSNENQFREERAALFADLIEQAANGTSQLKVGVGSRNFSDPEFSAIYALVQCSPQFSLEDCRRCLNEVAQGFRVYVSQGFRVLNSNCNARYELIPFYNETRLTELGVRIVASQPPPTSPPGNP